MPAVVAVEAQGCELPQPRHGVATRVGDGLYLTAGHLVTGDLRWVHVDGAPGRVVQIDDRLDLALVASTDTDQSVPGWWSAAVSGVAPSAEVKPGTVSIHRPEGDIPTRLNRTLTLRVDDRSAGEVHERPVLELDVVVEPGDSGSPVLDIGGRVIGVVVLSREPAGVSYATRVSPPPEGSPAAGDPLPGSDRGSKRPLPVVVAQTCP